MSFWIHLYCFLVINMAAVNIVLFNGNLLFDYHIYSIAYACNILKVLWINVQVWSMPACFKV